MSDLRQRYSFYGAESLKDSLPEEAAWKSDINISANQGIKSSSRGTYDVSKSCSSYRNSSVDNYEYDIVPVKENSIKVTPGFQKIEAGDSDKISLTDSELKRLEKKIYNTISKELQTYDSSVSSLNSNIQFIKKTMLEIFDTFNASMRDIEVYKIRFEEILAKNKVDAVSEMQSFIEDSFNQILSSDSNPRQEDQKCEGNPTINDIKVKGDVTHVHSTTSSATNMQTVNLLESLHSVVEAYKSNNFQCDSPLEDVSLNTSTKREEILNINVRGEVPCVQTKINDRNLFSEINIKNSYNEHNYRHISSVENLKNQVVKKHQHKEHVKCLDQSVVSLDREIPIKASFAKKNICLDEDYAQQREKDENKSFISKICNYICKKLRRS